MTGPEAKEAHDKAMALVKEGKYLEALLVPMLSSDLQHVVKKVREAVAASANRNDTKEAT